MKDNEKVQSVDLALVLGYVAIKDLATNEKKVAVLNSVGLFEHRYGYNLRHGRDSYPHTQVQDQERLVSMASKSKAKTSETSTEILMLGYMCIKGADNLPEKVNILDRFGLAGTDIATICECAFAVRSRCTPEIWQTK